MVIDQNGFSAKETGGFRVGDEIIYGNRNSFSKIRPGEPGVVVGFRHDDFGCTVAVSFPGRAGDFNNLGVLLGDNSGLYCNPKNLVLCESNDAAIFETGDVEVLFDE